MIVRLAALRHPDSDEKLVRTIWTLVLVESVVVVLLTAFVAFVTLDRKANIVSWLFVVATLVLPLAFAGAFLSQIGALGHAPWGLWGTVSRAGAERDRGEGSGAR